jgi:ABC-type branched-subunit amino acid transport system substrate-binding protein
MLGSFLSGFFSIRKVFAIGALLGLMGCEQMPAVQLPKLDRSKPIPVALLVPTSDADIANLAQSLENAARLAVQESPDVVIDLRVYDTAGNETIAAQVAQQAVDDGAQIILGPLRAETANAAAVAVADDGVNVISFSNNPTIAGGNLYLLGKTFDNTAEQLLEFAAAQGKSRAVVVYPNNIEGTFGLQAFRKAAQKSGITIVSEQGFEFNETAVINAIPMIRAAVEIEQADLLLLTSTSSGALPLLAQLLPENGLDPMKIQYAGLARWDVPAQMLDLPGVQNGWFAVPDTAGNENFATRYELANGGRPHNLAGLAYDAVSIITQIGRSDGGAVLSAQNLTNPNGFKGVDGIFRLKNDGTNERALSIAQIIEKQVTILDPAARAFSIEGF